MAWELPISWSTLLKGTWERRNGKVAPWTRDFHLFSFQLRGLRLTLSQTDGRLAYPLDRSDGSIHSHRHQINSSPKLTAREEDCRDPIYGHQQSQVS